MEGIQCIYTWKDIDRIFKYFNRDSGHPYINEVEVYHDQVIVSLNDMSRKEETKKVLKNLLEKHYDMENDIIKFDQFERSIPVLWEEDEKNRVEKKILPLFESVIYSDISYEQEMFEDMQLKDCPVIAFHSYKGGVGRTLALLAFVKAWSENRPDQRLLVIDADIEAPGLTWLMNDEGERDSQLCYFDLLEMIQSSQLDQKDVFDKTTKMLELQKMQVDSGKTIAEHFFIPTYRYEQQLLDIYASPESIVKGLKKKYIIAEKISEIGKKLGASAVLVDLRAGISEFSAPLLFDPRVSKYVVSSTSDQSIKGTQMILQLICRGIPSTASAIIPNVLLTMITGEADAAKLKGELLQPYSDIKQEYTDNIVTELPFASELVHLGSLQQTFKKLEGRSFYYNILQIVKEFYTEEHREKKIENNPDRESMIQAIHSFAKNQINAEINAKFNVLLTKPIVNLIKKYNASVPQAVVIGAKGAGKTFLYRELLTELRWDLFCEKYIGEKSDNATYIIPLIAPKSIGEMKSVIQDAIEYFRKETDLFSGDPFYWFENGKILRSNLKEKGDLQQWENIWKKCMLNAISENYNGTLSDLDKELNRRNINILFVADGLEEIFENTLEDEAERFAVRALVQDVLNEIKLQYGHIGLLVFLRKDLSNNSIVTNREHFEKQNRNYELNWAQNDALTLAVWLVDQAVPEFYGLNGRMENITEEMLKESLVRFWGLKLGKNSSNEAYSSRWILAALSDFHGQLQARDIVRFLEKATAKKGSVLYDDRILMPKEIKDAVQECSEAKVQEIKDEMKDLKSAIGKLENAPEETKVLPFSTGAFGLTPKEETMMIQVGLLKIDEGYYYIPEIIRHALNFKYKKGARPKVLSLLLK